MTTTVSSTGQVDLPLELRTLDGIAPGEKFEIERMDAGQYLLKRQVDGNGRGLVDWLLGCPTKGWFQPVA